MSEWFKEPVLKTGELERVRGFESHPLRQKFKMGCRSMAGQQPLELFIGVRIPAPQPNLKGDFMKKFRKIIGVVLIFAAIFASNSFAGDKKDITHQQPQHVLKKYDLAKELSQLAASIMQRRQNGVLMSDMMDKALNVKNKSVRQLILRMIKQAYETPKFNLEKYKQNVIREFENKWYKEVIDTLDGV